MKKKAKSRAKKDFARFSKRNTHKRRKRESERRELLRSVAASGVGYDSVRIKADAPHERARLKTLTGVYIGTSSGYGFVRCEAEREDDIFIPSGKSAGAIDGDLVDVAFREYESFNGEKRTEGRIVRIAEHGRQTLIGELCLAKERGRRYFYVLPDEHRLALRPVVSDTAGASVGEKVMVALKRSGGLVSASVIDSYGDANTREANYKAILDECGIDTEFTDEELLYAERVAKMPLSDEGRVRRDKDVIFTIDGEGAKDLDDAVSIRRTRGGYLLGVHIADVSAYVTERTPLDRVVMRRGTSVYFTDKVVPMLPPSLSNGACSLNAGEEKYAISAMISVSDDGEIRGLKIEPSIIKSCVRGVYSEVNKIFDTGITDADKAQLLKKYERALPSLKQMRRLYEILLKKSFSRGALDMEIPEAEIILDKRGIPTDIIKRERGCAERMIEQFMLLANEAVATQLYERGIPCVYRVHERPAEDKRPAFIAYAMNLGLDVSGIKDESATGRDYSRLLSEADEKGILSQVSRVMLRSMAKAKYSEQRQLHFGLGIENYCHFTSPIRRLSDLATHRIIRRVLLEKRGSLQYVSYAKRAAAAATEGEQRAVNAERRIENLYKTVYMSEHIGEQFDAVVSSVTSFGMFLELENTCEGLIPISKLPGDFFFDEGNMSLRSKKEVFHIGDSLRIRVEEADIVRGKLRFSLCERGVSL